MKFFVKIKQFESIHGKAAQELWGPIGKRIQKITSSGKFVDGAIFGGQRGGYLVLDVQSAIEIDELLSATLLDNFHVECYPLMGFDELGALFKKMMAEKD